MTVGLDTNGRLIRVNPSTADPTCTNEIQGHASNDIAGGDANVISGGGNGSLTNRMTGSNSYRTISGGYDNLIGDAIASTVGGGAHHQITSTATHGTVGGGSLNTITAGDYCTIAGGSTNAIAATQATIGGGVGNSAGDTATVSGGSTNAALGQWSSIGGGITHSITATSASSTIAGGNTIVLTNASFSSVGGGYQQSAGTASLSALGCTIAGGYQNTIAQAQQAQYSVISGGRINTVNADYGHVPGGYSNSVTGAFGSASGAQAKAYLRGQFARASGFIAAIGDAQTSVLTAVKVTANATPVDLALDGASVALVLPNNTVWGFEISVVATRSDVVGEFAKYTHTGLITRSSNAASTVLRQSTTTTVFETTAAWDCAVSADTTAGSLKITATGEAAKTIRWVARIVLTEVASA